MELNSVCIYLGFSTDERNVLDKCLSKISAAPSLGEKISNVFNKKKEKNEEWQKASTLLESKLISSLPPEASKTVAEFVIRYFVTLNSKTKSENCLVDELRPILKEIRFEEVMDRAPLGKGDDLPQLDKEQIIKLLKNEENRCLEKLKALDESCPSETKTKIAVKLNEIKNHPAFKEENHQISDKQLYSHLTAIRSGLKEIDKLIFQLQVEEIAKEGD